MKTSLIHAKQSRADHIASISWSMVVVKIKTAIYLVKQSVGRRRKREAGAGRGRARRAGVVLVVELPSKKRSSRDKCSRARDGRQRDDRALNIELTSSEGRAHARGRSCNRVRRPATELTGNQRRSTDGARSGSSDGRRIPATGSQTGRGDTGHGSIIATSELQRITSSHQATAEEARARIGRREE
jgi:hypothetical protein